MVARRAVLVLCLLLPVAVPEAASAATAGRTAGGALEVTGGSEQNTVTIALGSGSYTVTDSAGMNEGPGCSHVSATTSSCAAAPVTSFKADLGAGNDSFSTTAPTPVTVIGGPGNDTMHGGPGNDMLVGESVPGDSTTGQNTMDGGSGNDTIEGASGPDTITGGANDDTANGGGGADMVDGGDGNDVVSGGDGNDTMLGGAGDDQLGLGPDSMGRPRERGDDHLSGGAGNDVLQPGLGPRDGGSDDDTLAGGDGVDEVTYALRTTSVVVSIDGVANDGAGGAGEHDNVGPDVEKVIGGSADDQISGGPGAETLSGGPGNDSVSGGPGADVVSGGPGVDSTSYASAVGPVTVTLDGQPDDGPPGEGDNVGSDVENVGGSPGEDTFTGSAAANSLDTGGGEDYVDGGAGPDAMSAGGGIDVVRARDGEADTVACGSSKDFAIVDAKDTVAKSCEAVDRGRFRRPRLGLRMLLRPLRGGESFALSGMHRTVPLRDRIGLPFGSRLDATRGAIRLTAAAGTGRRSQFGDFSGGQFLVKQPRSLLGLTELTLTGGNLTKCAATGAAGARGAAAHTVLRRLFGRAHGRFRTRGRYSTATVRGTQWTVTDRCDGTLTTVKSGTVVVLDRVRHRSVTLKSGQSYLARRGNR